MFVVAVLKLTHPHIIVLGDKAGCNNFGEWKRTSGKIKKEIRRAPNDRSKSYTPDKNQE